MIIFLVVFGVRFWWHLVPTWLPLGCQNLPKIEPSWLQDPSKIGSRCRPIFCLIFDRPGIVFFPILLRSWTAKGPKKPFQSVELSANLLFFVISANLPTRGHMIDFLVNLAPNLAPKTHQKSTQQAPKIDEKGH